MLITSVWIGPAFVVFYLLSLPLSPQARIPSFPPKGIHSHTSDVWPQLHTLKIIVSVVCQPPREHLKVTDPEASQLQHLRAEPSFLSVSLSIAHLLLGGCTKPHLWTEEPAHNPRWQLMGVHIGMPYIFGCSGSGAPRSHTSLCSGDSSGMGMATILQGHPTAGPTLRVLPPKILLQTT